MPDYSDILDKRLEEIDSTRIYRIVTVIIDGVEFECGECDDGIEKMLRFKGTGRIIDFKDVLREYGRYWNDWFDHIMATGKKKDKIIWLCDWVEKNNYQLRFETGDITIRARVKAN